MNMTKMSVKRPLTILMIFLVFIMFGAIGYQKMPQNLMPDMDIPVTMVMVQWPGASPEDVDEQISSPLSKAISSISNIKNTISQSGESSAIIVAQFEYGTDINEKLNDIRSKVDSVKVNFPDDVSSPSILKMDMNAQDIAKCVVSGEGSEDDIMKYIEDNVQQRIEAIDGITQISVSGGQKTQISIKVLPENLSSYKVSLDTIKGMLMSVNKSYPYGAISEGENKIVIRNVDKAESLDDIKSIPIPTNTGETIPLESLCDISYEKEEQDAIVRYNGEPSIVIGIQKQQDANTVQVMKNVQKAVKELNEENSQFNINITVDTSTYISSSIKDVMENLILSAVIAFLVILLFLKNARASFVVAVSIPTSVIGSIALLYFTGETLNMITLSSLVIAVGMVVDNATVVIENIFKHKNSKEIGIDEASIEGTQTVSTAVLASTLTSVAIFLPILFTDGFTKILFGAFSKTLIFALSISFIVAITLVPSIFAKLNRKNSSAVMKEKNSPVFEKVKNIYSKIISKALNHKGAVIITSLVMFALSAGICFIGLIGIDFMPEMDEGRIKITVGTPEGLDLKPSDYYVSMAEEKLSDIEEIETIMTQIGGTQKTSLNTKPSIIINLVPASERKRSTKEVAEEITEKMETVPDCTMSVAQQSSMMAGMSDSLQVDIKGPDIETLEKIAEMAKESVEKLDGFREVKTSLSATDQEAKFKIDKRKAAQYGINTANIASTIRTAISGTDVATVTIDEYSYDINLSFPKERIKNVDDVGQIKVLTARGDEVPLSAFADITMEDSLQNISRSGSDYSVSITASAENMSTSEASSLMKKAIEEINMPRDYEIYVSGQAEMMYESIESLAVSVLIAIVLVYMVMAAQFESFSKPFIIMFSIPFAFVGVVFAFLITRSTLNVVGMLGAILLIGIVVNNGIVLIDYISQLREAEKERKLEDIVKEACKARLRPVLMTTLTTIVGMIPTALGFGEGGGMMQPLAIVIIGGLTVSTLVTLVLIPTLYVIFDKFFSKNHRKIKHKRKDKNLIKSQEAASEKAEQF